MARIRTIKPEFFANEKLSTLPTDTVLLAAALLCYADDEGYFFAHPGLVRAGCLPLREDSRSITGMLRELSDIGFVELNTCPEGKALGRIPKFRTHQVINKAKPSKIRPLWKVPDDYGSPTGQVRVGKGTGNREKEQGKGIKPTVTQYASREKAPELDANGDTTPTPVEQPEDTPPAGVIPITTPALLGNPEVYAMANLIALATPEARLRSLDVSEITYAHRVAIITAAKHEAHKLGVGVVQAMNGLLATVEAQCEALPPERLQFQGNIETYFRKHTYRVDPQNLTGENNGKSKGDCIADAVRQAKRLVAQRSTTGHGDGPVGNPRSESLSKTLGAGPSRSFA